MLLIAVVIITAWAVLIGLPYRLETRSRAVIAALTTYATLAATTLAILGLDWQGYAAAFGLLLPLAAGLTLAVFKPPRPKPHAAEPPAPPPPRS